MRPLKKKRGGGDLTDFKKMGKKKVPDSDY